MKKIIAVIVVLIIAMLTISVPASAAFNKQVTDNGPHFNLNIIGVPKGKTADMTNSNGHTIFVSLDKASKITVEANTEDPTAFQVLDANATDGGTAVLAVPYTVYGTLSYDVWAIALGKPNGDVTVNASYTFSDNTDGALLETTFDLARKNGTPKAENISDMFRASGTITNSDGSTTTFSNVWIFNVPTLLDYYWTYTNNNLKLMQLRFYETPSGSWATIPAS